MGIQRYKVILPITIPPVGGFISHGDQACPDNVYLKIKFTKCHDQGVVIKWATYGKGQPRPPLHMSLAFNTLK